MEVVQWGMARAGVDARMAGFSGGSRDGTRGFGGGFWEWRARRIVRRQVWISVAVVVGLGDGASALGDGDGAAARSGRGGFLGMAARSALGARRRSRTGLLWCLGTGMAAAGSGCGVGGDGSCGIGGCVCGVGGESRLEGG
jgi:hypothetical protein